MNPQTKYETGDTTTTRAFVSLFRKIGDEFQFAVDRGVNDEEEVRAYLIPEDLDYNGQTMIGVTAINEKERFESIKNKIQEMGLDIVESDTTEEYHDSIGDYVAYTLLATAPSNLSEEWNVPHLIVYGSLNPEIKECCRAAFGNKYNYENIRNHFVVYGDGVTTEAKTKLATAVQNSNSFFDDMQRDTVSSINTSTLV